MEMDEFDEQDFVFDDPAAETDDHSNSVDSVSAAETLPGPSTEMDKQSGNGKGPKRKNLRHVLSPEQLGAETLEERRREQERQQRLQQMLLASSRYYQQQQQVQQRPQNFSGFPPYSYGRQVQLSEKERADLAARQAVWYNFKRSKSAAGGDDDEVVVLSSDDEENEGGKASKPSGDSDDDVVCLGSDVEDEAGPSSQDNAASAHANDDFNIPDAEGRVLINVGHADSEPDIFLPQHLVSAIKPHQIGGLRFMYDNVVESISNFNPNGGFGCILAHSMGLGKTFQVVSFTDIVYRHSPLKRVLLIVPINTLQNWLQEYEMWLPKSSFIHDVPPRQFDVSIISDNCKTWASRVDVINEWYQKSGVLIMGYEMFRILANKIGGVSVKKKNGDAAQQRTTNEEGVDLTSVAKALLDPGPDLVVCDEGHRIKNFQSNTSKALSNIRTKRRVVLTGYPLQNNLIEYWCMVNFVRPNYLGTRQEFAGVFERPIRNGQCVDSTEKDIKVMRYRVHVLTNLLKGFVQRRSHALLSTTLPRKSEYVLFVRKSPIQHRLYRRFIVECTADMREDVACWNPLKAFAVCCKIWNHPDVLYKAFKDHVDAVDGDLDLGTFEPNQSHQRNGKQAAKMESDPSDDAMFSGLYQFRTKNDRRHIDYRWAEELFKTYVPGIMENGMKMRLALGIIERSVLQDDKILLFSQSLLTLDAVESFLNARVIPNSNEHWKKNRSYFRLDGSTNSIERQRLIARFNNERGVHLFLISTRAGSLGINLVGANRVIVFDASFNPCHDAQAVCRVYRYGQRKSTFIYRLVADNSMEKTIFNRQLGKQGIADRVIDERAVNAAVRQQDLYDLLQYNEELDMLTEDCKIDAESFNDDLLVDVCRELSDCFAKAPVKHESLMLDKGEQQLSEAEKREAKRGYEREKKALKNGGNVDWKRWNGDPMNKPRPNILEPKLHHERSWMDNGPPAKRFTPVPMGLQAVPYPQIPNGVGPSLASWPYPQMTLQQPSYFPHGSSELPQINYQPNPNCAVSTRMQTKANANSLPDPELVTLSDDEA